MIDPFAMESIESLATRMVAARQRLQPGVLAGAAFDEERKAYDFLVTKLSWLLSEPVQVQNKRFSRFEAGPTGPYGVMVETLRQPGEVPSNAMDNGKFRKELLPK